jgi:hypothetical protein
VAKLALFAIFEPLLGKHRKERDTSFLFFKYRTTFNINIPVGKTCFVKNQKFFFFLRLRTTFPAFTTPFSLFEATFSANTVMTSA